MKKPSLTAPRTWLPKISFSLPKTLGGKSSFLKKPARPSLKDRRIQWALFCAAYSVLLNIGMYLSIGWTYPSADTMNFREEVSTLLNIQTHLAKADTKAAPTMDSIRDVMFGPKTVGADLRTKAETMLQDREKIGMAPELAAIVEKSLTQWRVAEKRLTRDRAFFIAGFLTLSLGLPALFFLLGLPLYKKAADKVFARLAKRRADKKAAGDRQRQLMSTRAKEKLSRKTTSSASSSKDKNPT